MRIRSRLESRDSPHFFKVFLPHFSSKQLKIPIAFMKHMKNVTYGTCSIKGPSGRVWEVCLRKHIDGLFFEEGWPVFVRDHFVETGDFFVFKYHGNLRFTVQVFDKTALEKESLFFDAVCGSQYSSNRFEMVPYLKNCLSMKMEEAAEVSEDSSCGTSSKYLSHSVGNRDGTRKLSKYGRKSLTMEDANRRAQMRLGALISQRRDVTIEEKEKVIQAANMFKSKYPFATVVMRPSYVYFGFYLSLPCSFWKFHLPKFNQEMVLWDPSGREWPVRFVISTRQAGLSAGWGRFSRHHNLEADDVCIFELIKPKEMRVRIYRVVEEIRPYIQFTKSGFKSKSDIQVEDSSD